VKTIFGNEGQITGLLFEDEGPHLAPFVLQGKIDVARWGNPHVGNLPLYPDIDEVFPQKVLYLLGQLADGIDKLPSDLHGYLPLDLGRLYQRASLISMGKSNPNPSKEEARGGLVGFTLDKVMEPAKCYPRTSIWEPMVSCRRFTNGI
jgi:hypothetical protein